MENIRVVVRVRQILCMERKVGDVSCVDVHHCGKKLEVKINPTKTEVYKCGKCFPRLTPQHIIFEESGVLNLIDRALNGNSVNIITFGQHASGKSFTLFGAPKCQERNLGLIVRSLKYIFDKLDSLKVKYNLRLTCVGIHEEQIFDMFAPQNERRTLSLQKSPSGEITVRDCQYILCSSYAAACASLECVSNERCSGNCPQNSHCVVEVHIDIPVEEDSLPSGKEQNTVRLGKISFVDLAASEFLTKRETDDGTIIHEDRSLSILSRTIDGTEKINNHNATVMDSSFTALLCDSIGVPGCSLLISCICEAKLNIEETVKTLQFSCTHVPKMLKYFDAQAKIAYDLQKELHYLNRQNRKLRTTMLSAPTYELHTLSLATPSAIKKEREQEKALIAMHNELLRANTTYKFKPRGGGRMYFPSPVAGREIPMKPTNQSHSKSQHSLTSGAYLEDSSVLSGMRPSSSHALYREDSRLATDTPQPFTTSPTTHSHSRKAPLTVTVATMDDLVRKRGATGPIVFRTKRPEGSGSREPESALQVQPIEPLRDTTRLGFNKEGKDWPQEDWPKEIRHRIALLATSDEVKEAPRDPKLDKTEPLFTWTPDISTNSPFVAHLKPHTKKVLPKVAITTRLTPAEDRPSKFRPSTAPISESVAPCPCGPAVRTSVSPPSRGIILRSSYSGSPSRPRSSNDATGRSRPVSSNIGREDCRNDELIVTDNVNTATTADHEMKSTEENARTMLDKSECATASTAVYAAAAAAAKVEKKKRTSAGRSRENSSASPSRPISANISRPMSAVSAGLTPLAASLAPTPVPTSTENTRPSSAELLVSSISAEACGFNPLKPSVFAASLMSDQGSLARRQSAVSSTTDSFNAMFGVPEDPYRLSPVLEEHRRPGQTVPPLGAFLNTSSQRQQLSEKLNYSKDGGSSEISRLSSKSNSFSSLPSVESTGPRLKQKSKSMKIFHK